MEDPTAIEPMDVVVSNVALSDEDVESNKKLVALLGVPSRSFRRQGDANSRPIERCAWSQNKSSRSRVGIHQRAEKLGFVYARGEMRRRYSHPRRERESAGSQTVDIEVSGEQPAEFIDAPVETTAPGELPTTEAPEAIDYDGRVEACEQ